MTQTTKGKTPSSTTVSKTPSSRPGQRQQERLLRQARRRKRMQITWSIILAILVIALFGVGIWQYQRIQNDQTQLAYQNETATANTQNTHATATAQALNSYATATAQVLASTPTPVVGAPTPAPATPPIVTATPTKLADGLEYIDLKEGKGLPAQTGSAVTVYYTGWLQDGGKKFDSSYDDGKQPLTVTIGQGQVIKGMEEGLVGIKSGGTRRLIIPGDGDLAYGAQGAGNGVIPPNATLIFDVTVISIK